MSRARLTLVQMADLLDGQAEATEACRNHMELLAALGGAGTRAAMQRAMEEAEAMRAAAELMRALNDNPNLAFEANARTLKGLLP